MCVPLWWRLMALPRIYIRWIERKLLALNVAHDPILSTKAETEKLQTGLSLTRPAAQAKRAFSIISISSWTDRFISIWFCRFSVRCWCKQVWCDAHTSLSEFFVNPFPVRAACALGYRFRCSLRAAKELIDVWKAKQQVVAAVHGPRALKHYTLLNAELFA